MLISFNSTNKIISSLSKGEDIYCYGLFLSARWFVISVVEHKGIQLIILPNKEAAEYCAADLYNLIEGDNVFFLPDSGKNIQRSNYKATLNVQRTAAIAEIMNYSGIKPLYLITYPAALEENIPDIKNVKKTVLKLSVGNEISHQSIIEILFNQGFERVDFVGEPGQFAVRGALVDIFSYSYNNPFRISFFGDEIDSINVFDSNTQLSIEKKENVDIYPSLNIEQGNGVSILSILPQETLVWLDSSDMYKDKSFMEPIQLFHKVYLDTPLERKKEESIQFSISPQPVFNKNFELLTFDIRQKIESGYKVKIYGEKKSQLERLKNILVENEGLLPEFISKKNIHEGFIDNENKVCHYTDHEIFDRFHRVTIRRTVENSEQLTINDLTSFSIGDYIIHIDHGIGIFGGLVRVKDDRGRMNEVVKLIYRDNDVVFVSVHALHKISRYKSKEAEDVKINKLGSKVWQNLKASAKSKVKDIAKDLIKLYAKRKASKGFAFSADTYLQQELESSFIYEDTPDQEKAIIAVKRDMEDDCPMDRLVCGDVGFGKTEVAIRAAFKAVTDSKQVAVLVPTTILALQHYNTFIGRLEDFPCNIDYVSRLRTSKEISNIKERLKTGSLDIVIGTHKLIGKGFEFKDLGLLIIDEEQKFGVSAKEKLRQLKTNVDTLTLTATPIPRTLQFSLLGARDLSIINTPPPNRIPIQTEIILFELNEIKNIINYELNRGGQIFFVHNRVEELPSIYDILHRLIPDMKICIVHGQMKPKDIENRILDFIEGDYDLLLSTTIIENGLDIPNANTMIINQAQNIGLSDLHQLRGRVGRSNKRAFCYLIVPPLISISEDARRRLKAIESFSDLGSGFNIAMQDLDIRGAGNLLGAEQSGFIADMGFETYQKILTEAIEELGVETGLTTRTVSEHYTSDCTIETDFIALISDDYIDITAEKIRIYKDLNSLTSEKEVDKMFEKIVDRFGKMPEEAERLFDIVKIRLLGIELGFEKIIIKNGVLIAFFISNPMSKYYKSNKFASIMENLNKYQNIELKQSNGKLRIFVKNINTLSQAHHLLNSLSN